MAKINWGADPGALSTAITGANLNSLANNTTEYTGSQVIDNEDADFHTFMDLELYLASLDLSAQTNPSVTIYLIESVDGGTNYDTAEDAVSAATDIPPADKICCIFGLRPDTGAEAKYAIKTMIPIPPGHFKLLLRNTTGVAFAASGNTLEYRTYDLAST